MNDGISQFEDSRGERIDLAIAVELSMGRLYRRLADVYPEHADTWWRVSMEEMNHASLLRAARDLMAFGVAPGEFLSGEVESLASLCGRVDALEATVAAGELNQAAVYTKVLALESEVGDQGLQSPAQLDGTSRLGRVLARLHAEFDDHATVIRGLLEQIQRPLKV